MGQAAVALFWNGLGGLELGKVCCFVRDCGEIVGGEGERWMD